jgi:hypothetical protein
MKSILLSLLLLTSTLCSAEVLSNLVYTAPGVRIYVVTIITDINVVSQPVITNTPTVVVPTNNVVVNEDTNSTIYQLRAKIKLEEAKIREWNSWPQYYVDNSSPQAKSNLDRLLEIWEQKNKSVSNLNVLKLQLEKLNEPKRNN